MKTSTFAAHGVVAFTLAILLFLLAAPGVQTGPFSYDEADYAYAANQGWFANWIDHPALNLVQFVRLGLASGRDSNHRTELSEIIRNSGDIHFYRHWHGPLFYYWLGFVSHWTQNEHRVRFVTLLIPAVGVLLVYFGCLWVLPSSPLIAMLAAGFYAAGYSVVASPELAPHQLFAVVSLANLFCLAKLETTREQRWWWWACVCAAASFVTIEVAFVNIAVLLAFAWHCRSIFPSYRQALLRSFGLFLAVVLVLWPAGILKLEPVRSYIFMAYLAIFRKGAWGNTTLLETWWVRFHSEPFEWLFVVLALALWWFLPYKKEKQAAAPFLLYGGLMFVVMFRVNATLPHYVLPFLPPLLVFAGITLGAAMQSLRKPVQMALAAAMILLIAVGTWRYVHAHLPGENSRAQQILLSLRAKPLDGKTLLAPHDDVTLLHYYFPRVNLALYVDEKSRQQAISSGGIDAILSDDKKPFQIEYFGRQQP